MKDKYVVFKHTFTHSIFHFSSCSYPYYISSNAKITKTDNNNDHYNDDKFTTIKLKIVFELITAVLGFRGIFRMLGMFFFILFLFFTSNHNKMNSSYSVEHCKRKQKLQGSISQNGEYQGEFDINEYSKYIQSIMSYEYWRC